MATTWTCYVVETITGRIVDQLPFIGVPQWSRQLKTKGQLDVTTIPDAEGMPPIADLRAWVAGGRFSLAYAYGDWIAQAGPVWQHVYADDERGELQIGCAGLGSIFDSRLVLPAGWAFVTDAQGQHLTSTSDTVFNTTTAPISNRNLALHSVLMRLFEQATTRPGQALPLVLPDPIAGTTERTYRAWELGGVWERVVQIANLLDGPDFEVVPRFAATEGFVEWVLRVGNPDLAQAGDRPRFDYGAGMSRVGVRRDATRLQSDTWLPGSGIDEGTRIARAADDTLTAAGFPQLDGTSREHTSVELQSTLDGHAQGYNAVLSRPVETWYATIRADGGGTGADKAGPALGEVADGDTAMFGIQGHRWIPDGEYPRRILGMTNASTLAEAQLIVEAGAGVI